MHGRLYMRASLLGAACLLLGACAAHPPAPISSKSFNAAVPAVSRPSPPPATYRVQPGDTLNVIARRFGLSPAQVVQWNRLSSPDTLLVGQILRLRAPDPDTRLAATDARPAADAADPVPEVSVTPISLPAAPKGQDLAPTVAATASPQPAPKAAVPTGETPKAGSNTKPAAAAAPPTPAASPWSWPADGPILACFDPGPGMRHGIDIGGKLGDPVRAAAAGRVLYTGSGLRGYGRLIIIRHEHNYITAYAHNAQLLVKEGTWVKAGQVIARMGQSGNAGRVLLHFEVRKQGRPQDPLALLPPRPVSAHP